MTSISKAIAIAAMLAASAAALASPVSAGAGNPFYPDRFANPQLPYPSVGAGSGIPRAYRLGD